MRGVVLLAIGKTEYGVAAYYMALSIHYYNPTIPIQLIYERRTLTMLEAHQLTHFTILTEIAPDDAYLGKKLSPGKAKLSIYKYLAFDENIYLDVDGLCTRNLLGLFPLCTSFYHCQVSEIKQDFGWATIDEVHKHYALPEKYVIYSTNSSFQYIRKGKEAQEFYERLLSNYRPEVPMHYLWNSGFPDELAVEVSLAQTGINPTIPGHIGEFPIYFRPRQQYNLPRISLVELETDYYGIGCYGKYGYAHGSVYECYNELIHKIHKQLIGERPNYKAADLFQKN